MAKIDNVELKLFEEMDLSSWVMAQCDEWRDHYNNNYEKKFKEYYRIWRGIYDPADKTRPSERSQIISPATSQAIESSVAEIEEATFNRGRFFDIRDDIVIPETPSQEMSEQEAMILQAEMQQKQIEKIKIKHLRDKLDQDFKDQKIRKQMGEVLINAAVFGTGIAEIVIDIENEKKAASQQMGDVMAHGITEREKTVVKLKPVLPQNFLIDPIATSVNDSIGVAIDEDVSPHSIRILQEQGVYKDVTVGSTSTPDDNIEADPTLVEQPDNTVRLIKYFGLVPRKMLDEYEGITSLSELDEVIEETTDLGDVEEITEVDEDIMIDEPYYVEACVVIANGSTILKAQENPYMMSDRPILAFPWDVVPSRFWGRGVAEKAFHSQKALDTELRARIDALALTNAPMIAMDGTRMPRGAQPEVRPGKILLTNGDPREVLQPFNFGQVSQITFAQAEALQRMVQTATGAIDSAGIPGSINGEATAAGISMNLSAIIKRHKRTLVNFQESFLIPFVKAAACRYMQFDPESYPVEDYVFEVTSTLGIIAREYEVTQLVQLLQTMSQESPIYPLLIKAIVDNMSLSNREELNQMIDASMQPDPQQQEMAQLSAQTQMAFTQSQTAALVGQAKESEARAKKADAETKAVPVRLENDRIEAIADIKRADGELDKDVKASLKIAETAIKEKKVGIEERKLNVSA